MKRPLVLCLLITLGLSSACAYLAPVPPHVRGWDQARDHCYDALVAKRSSARRAQIISATLTLVGGVLGIGGGALGLQEGKVDPVTMKADANYAAAASSGIGGLLVVASQIVEPIGEATKRYQMALKDYQEGVGNADGRAALERCVQ